MQEYCEECPDSYKTVRRDAAYKDNSLLPAQIALRTGDLIYEGLKNGFRVRHNIPTTLIIMYRSIVLVLIKTVITRVTAVIITVMTMIA